VIGSLAKTIGPSPMCTDREILASTFCGLEQLYGRTIGQRRHTGIAGCQPLAFRRKGAIGALVRIMIQCWVVARLRG